MSKFVLERSVDIKKRILTPIGLVSLFFLNMFLFHSAIASGILSIGLIVFIIYATITETKPYIEINNENLEFYSPFGRLIFSESIKSIKIKKLEIRIKDVLIGLGVSFTANNGTELSIGENDLQKKWLNRAEVVSSVKYYMNPTVWSVFVNNFGLGSELEDLNKNGFEMQQLSRHQNYYNNKIFWWILTGAGVFILLFGALFAWVIYNASL